MRIGQLDKCITLQRLKIERDVTSNEARVEVAEEFEAWASMRIVSSDETKGISGETLIGLAEFIFRYREDFDSRTWRIKTEDGKLWDAIDLPREIGRREGLRVIARWIDSRSGE